MKGQKEKYELSKRNNRVTIIKEKKKEIQVRRKKKRMKDTTEKKEIQVRRRKPNICVTKKKKNGTRKKITKTYEIKLNKYTFHQGKNK